MYSIIKNPKFKYTIEIPASNPHPNQKIHTLSVYSLLKNMKKILTIILLCIVNCTLLTDLNAQTIKELEAQKKKALDELAVTNRLLNETQKNKKSRTSSRV